MNDIGFCVCGGIYHYFVVFRGMMEYLSIWQTVSMLVVSSVCVYLIWCEWESVWVYTCTCVNVCVLTVCTYKYELCMFELVVFLT